MEQRGTEHFLEAALGFCTALLGGEREEEGQLEQKRKARGEARVSKEWSFTELDMNVLGRAGGGGAVGGAEGAGDAGDLDGLLVGHAAVRGRVLVVGGRGAGQESEGQELEHVERQRANHKARLIFYEWFRETDF